MTMVVKFVMIEGISDQKVVYAEGWQICLYMVGIKTTRLNCIYLMLQKKKMGQWLTHFKKKYELVFGVNKMLNQTSINMISKFYIFICVQGYRLYSDYWGTRLDAKIRDLN